MFDGCKRRHLAIFLRALKGSSCPLCVLLAIRTRELLRSAALRPETELLCSRHVKLVLNHFDEPSALARALRSVLLQSSATTFRADPACSICASLEHTTTFIARAIQRSDQKPRFRNAINSGPLFCRRHRERLNREGASHFARAQPTKLKRLADDLAQLERSPATLKDNSIAQALAYLSPISPMAIDTKR